MSEALTTVGLIVSVIGGALGAFSIFVTWKLYQEGNRVNLETLKLLSEVNASTHTTEVTSTHFTERVVTAFIELVGRDVKSSLAVGRVNLGERIETLLQKELEQVNPDIAAKVREKVLAALSSTFKTMEFQTASVARLPEPEIAAASEMSGKAVVAAGVPSLIKWMDKNVIKYEFFSVKFLREKVFAADPVAQEALQFCIDQGIVETYQRANPKNPTRPTTACQLNRKHRVVRSVLGDDPAVDKKDGEN